MNEKTDDAIKKVPETLYHYTDQAGMLGILQTKVIWATKIQFLNDQQELHLAAELAKPVLSRKESRAKSNQEKEFFAHLAHIVDELTRFGSYICSFSEEPDVLSQWRAYSPYGTGYALGFDAEALRSPMEAQYFRLIDCLYDEAEQIRLLESMGRTAVRTFRKFHDPQRLPAEGQDFDDLLATRLFMIEFMLAGPMLKNEAFRDEVEWRIISDPYAELDPGRLKVRSGKSFPVPHYEFELTAPGEPLLLNEIVIGPCPEPDMAESAVKELFRPAGDVLCNNVRSSTIPYRNW